MPKNVAGSRKKLLASAGVLFGNRAIDPRTTLFDCAIVSILVQTSSVGLKNYIV